MLKSLQKSDEETIQLIERVRDYLFSVGIRASKERAWDILQNITQIPYDMLIENNEEIKYQGASRNIRKSSHPRQVLSIKDLGRYELKGLSTGKATIKFIPSETLKHKIEESVKVKE